jgi:putative oxidoreductase
MLPADLRLLVRPLLAAPFIVGGIRSLRAPKATADRVADVAVPIADAVGLPKDPETLVKINAGVQLAGGALLAFGIAPRLASLALAASIVPTTIAGHRFWEQDDPGDRSAHLTHFAKNAGLLGGLLIAALDTGGRPSVFWSGRRVAGHAAESLADTVNVAYHGLPGVG